MIISISINTNINITRTAYVGKSFTYSITTFWNVLLSAKTSPSLTVFKHRFLFYLNCNLGLLTSQFILSHEQTFLLSQNGGDLNVF